MRIIVGINVFHSDYWVKKPPKKGEIGPDTVKYALTVILESNTTGLAGCFNFTRETCAPMTPM